MKKLFILFFSVLLIKSNAQVSIKDSCIAIPMIAASFGFQVPGGDLAKRFGNNANTGISFKYKTKKNIITGIEWSYLFGKQIKENGILDSIATFEGFIINQNGEYADVRLYERGYNITLKFGKLIPIWGVNKNSGPFITAGVGMLQHRIRIEDIGNQSPQLSAEYKKGYDRLTNGLCLSQFIGYSHFGNKRLVNFYTGFEFTEAFTKSRRSYDYDLMQRDTLKRKDFLYGIRAGWILPLYKKTPKEFYYY